MTSSTTEKQPSGTSRPLKERQREERAALILEAAQDVFAEKGYHDASIDEIAARVGIAKGTVYLHFASKEDLVGALVEQQIVGFLAMVDQVTAEATNVRARLEQILEHTYTGLHRKRTQVLLQLNNSVGLTKSIIEKREGLSERMSEVAVRITALLEEGKRTGELDADIPTPVMLAAFLGLLSPRGYEQLLADGQFSSTELVTHISQIFFRGVSAPSSKES